MTTENRKADIRAEVPDPEVPEKMVKLKRFLTYIDCVNEWGGKIAALFLTILMVIVIYEVVMRYFFNMATDWAFEFTSFMMICLGALGGGYTLLYGGHVNIDIIYGKFSVRNRAFIDLITAFLFFIFIIVFLFQTGNMAIDSVMIAERSESTWSPVLYPVKIIIVIGGFLVFIQYIAKFLRDLLTIISKEK